METTNLTPAEGNKVNDAENAGNQELKRTKQTIAQTSAKAKRLLEKSKAKAEAEKGKAPVKGAPKGKEDKKAPKKEDKKADKKAPKKPVITLASKLDSIITAGGKWADLIEQCNNASKSLKYSTRYSVGGIKAHIKFRTVTQKNPQYLGNKEVTADGIVVKRAKKSNKKAA